MQPATEHPLRPICAAWMRVIQAAQKFKQEQFGDDAAEALRFFNGPYDWLYGDAAKKGQGLTVDDEEGLPEPSFRMTSNRVAEMVQLFGPSLYHKNPDRVVTPRQYPTLPAELFGDPSQPMAMMLMQTIDQAAAANSVQDQARATLLDGYLNFTPDKLNLKDEARLAIDEALIKGMGTLWTEVYTVPESNWRMAGSFFDSVDNLLLDPDAERFEDCAYAVRRCCHPTWKVEREYQLEPGSLHGNRKSFTEGAAGGKGRERYWSAPGESADLLCYFKVYSKMGVGGRLKGVPAGLGPVLDGYGDYAFLVIADGVPYPLNLPPEVLETADDAEIARRLQWPTPLWKDDAWPFTPIQFHRVPGQVWPMSHLKPALGELKFLNWAYSFLADNIRVTARQFIAILKSAGDGVKNVIQHGANLTIIELDMMHKRIDEVVQFLEHPPMNKDLWSVIEAVSEQFDKRTGLTELMYGESSRQLRSASEAEIKTDQLKIRPDDMNARVEEAMTEVARKEAVVARWHLRGPDVLPVLGPAGAYFWDRLVAGADADAITRQLEYRLEADSTRKPNRERQAQNMTNAMNNLFAPLMQYAGQTGNVSPVNSLIGDWAKSINLDASRYVLTPPPPPPAPVGAGGSGSPPRGAAPAAA